MQLSLTPLLLTHPQQGSVPRILVVGPTTAQPASQFPVPVGAPQARKHGAAGYIWFMGPTFDTRAVKYW